METTKLQLVLSEPTVPVPDTGRFVGLGSGTSQNIIITLAVVAVCLAVVGLIVYRVSRKSGRFSASGKSAFSLSRKNSLIRKFGLGMFVMVAIGVVAGLGAKVGKSFAADNYAAISVPEIVEMEGEISEATFVSGKLTVTMQDAASYGYDLYALAGGDLNFIPETEDNETVIDPISEQGALSANTWGFTLDADAKASDEAWYPLSDVATLVESYGEATVAGNETDIYFGVLIDDSVLADTYTLDVDFYSIAALADTFEQAFVAANVSKYDDTDYYAMQSMTTGICSDIVTPAATAATVPEVQLIDTRDNSVYWVAKLADGGCWMTQNLNFNIMATTTLDSTSTDLNSAGNGIYVEGYSMTDGVIYWTPATSSQNSVPDDSYSLPRSFNADDVYYYGNTDSYATLNYQTEEYCLAAGYSNEECTDDADIYLNTLETCEAAGYSEAECTATYDYEYGSLAACVAAGHSENECLHYSAGNYYNWTAAVASNESSAYTTAAKVAENSICPAGWRLPVGLTDDADYVGVTSSTSSEINRLLYAYGVVKKLSAGTSNAQYDTNGLRNIKIAPLYFVRSGIMHGYNISLVRATGEYWSSTTSSSASTSNALLFNNANSYAAYSASRDRGASIRCVAR